MNVTIVRKSDLPQERDRNKPLDGISIFSISTLTTYLAEVLILVDEEHFRVLKHRTAPLPKSSAPIAELGDYLTHGMWV